MSRKKTVVLLDSRFGSELAQTLLRYRSWRALVGTVVERVHIDVQTVTGCFQFPESFGREIEAKLNIRQPAHTSPHDVANVERTQIEAFDDDRDGV